MLQELALIDKLSEGIEIGRRQGRKSVIVETVKNLSSKGKSVSEIVEIMLNVCNISISKEEIKNILKAEN